ncbi:predicted protein [Lichtheimia corymbifera JMRC:FSU:9682]|uniref:F-box domain-containing protein n=1 Tax=Lichtheimia corymbifera JMRC:FSU:9682 TaxID=1263082 RepID=A0A068S5I9_9FUNG|nr:predicted protein [Lichtheimia corymbifera JMRC:FSU:9682]
MLEELDISCSVHAAESAVSHTTPLPPNLKALRLDLHYAITHVAAMHFVRYLHRYADHRQLKKLHIVFHNPKCIDDMLDAILHLRQLERLVIECTDDRHNTQMQCFLVGLAKACMKLSSLEIRCKKAPSTDSVNAMKQLEHLVEFTFSIRDMDDNDGFWHAIQTLSQLKCIHIYPAKTTKLHRLAPLHKERPDLKVVVNRRFA